MPQAHAMTTFQAAGAGQAVEDAYILGSILGHPLTTRTTIPAALKVYEEVRLPFALKVQKDSAIVGDISSFNDPRFAALADVRHSEMDMGKLKEVADAALGMQMWAWTTDIGDDERKAVALLEEKLSLY